tara:strand:- start:5793 stop:6404 length:612 start_codon:yes stop_codon:yes gene_type:complete
MKTKLLILTVLTTLLMTSCIKDYLGEQGSENIKFTSGNYLYEGDLYSLHLNDEIETLDIKIKELNDIINNNQGDEKTKEDLAAAIEQRQALNKDLQDIISLEQVGKRFPPPPPPCPRPRNCDFSGLEYILTPIGAEKIKIQFLDDKDTTIGGGTIEELSLLPDSKGLIKYGKTMTYGQSGSVVAIQVSVLNEVDKVLREYLIK